MLRILSRKSELAQTQSRSLQQYLASQGIASSLVLMESEGDANLKDPLYAMNTQPGVFTKRLEQALLSRQGELVVHSLKDLPTAPQNELKIAALSHRASTLDSLILREPGEGSLPLKKGARVGTSSLRREAQLLSVRSDLDVVPIRGNVGSRIRQVEEGKLDAVVLAAAGLERLGLQLKSLHRVDLTDPPFVPAPGQGVLAVQSRVDLDGDVEKALEGFHSERSEIETRIEREILRELEGGCSLPLGVRCESEGEQLRVRVFFGRNDPNNPHDWKSFHQTRWEGTDRGEAVRYSVHEMRGVLNG